MTVLAVALALLAAAASTFLAWREYRRTHELFTPWMLIMVYAALDIFLPAAAFLVVGPPSFPVWISPLKGTDIAEATLVYFAALLCFATGYCLVRSGARQKASATAGKPVIDLDLKVGRVYGLLSFTAGWYVLYEVTLIVKAGSLKAFLANSFRDRLPTDVFVSTSVPSFIFHQFAPAMLPCCLVLVGILFFFRFRYQRTLLWGLVLPVCAWCLTLTTFYRGSQINFFVSLAFLEACRIKMATRHPAARLGPAPARTGAIMSQRSKVLVAVGILFFLLYGAYRQYNSSSQYGTPTTVNQSLVSQGGEFTRGWGTVGLTSVLQFYPANRHFLGGGSVTSSLVMPVPRLIWSAKPEHYGAEVVTREMGWLQTTQSAITMPGELYADFGPIGIVFVAGFGMIFGALYRSRLHPKFFFVYAFFIPYSILLTQWFSTTGLMTSLNVFAPSIVAAWFVMVSRRPQTNKDGVSDDVFSGSAERETAYRCRSGP